MSKYLTIVYNAENMSVDSIRGLVTCDNVSHMYWGHAIYEMQELKSNKVDDPKYDDLKVNVKYALEEARGLYKDMKENGLSASTIEAEGYLRAFITVYNMFEDKD